MINIGDIHPGTQVRNIISDTEGIVFSIDQKNKNIKIISPKDVWRKKDVHSRWLYYHKSDMNYNVTFGEFKDNFTIKKPFSSQDMDTLQKELGHIKHAGDIGIPFRHTKQWPDPIPETIDTPEFKAILNVIKEWDIAVPGAYSGYCSATGNHVRAIMDGIGLGVVKKCIHCYNTEESVRVYKVDLSMSDKKSFYVCEDCAIKHHIDHKWKKLILNDRAVTKARKSLKTKSRQDKIKGRD